jgi:hypothetical protein
MGISSVQNNGNLTSIDNIIINLDDEDEDVPVN